MITLRERHQDKEPRELVRMIEHPEDYTEEYMKVIHEILDSKAINYM